MHNFWLGGGHAPWWVQNDVYSTGLPLGVIMARRPPRCCLSCSGNRGYGCGQS